MRKCHIISCENRHDPILLPHLKTITLGRGPLTKIKDTRLSRNHVELQADYDKGTVLARLVGANKSRFVGDIPPVNEPVLLKHGDTVELLEGVYPYRVEFCPVPATPSSSNEVDGKNTEVDEEMSKQSTLLSFLGKRKRDVSDKNDSPTKSDSPKKLELGVESVSSGKWENIDGGTLLVYTSPGAEGRSKIAAYDLDSTLITTKSGRVYPKGPDDWKLAYSEVPGTLKSFWKEGYKIVIITNQGGLGRGKSSVADFRQKVCSIIERLGTPVQVFIATSKSIYRKPAPGIWHYLTDKANDGVVIDKEASFFCGDAAGREDKWAPGKKKDHSLVDRLFAINVGLKFYTPEEHFLKHKPAPHKMPLFNPSEVGSTGSLLEPSSAALTQNKQEVILLVGSPGSGKSYFTRQYYSSLDSYVIVNRDTLGTWQKCLTQMESALDQGKSVVVDNTNPDKESRARFVKAAAARGIPIRCFVMNVDLLHAQHNNKFRELIDDKHEPVSEMVFNIFRSKYQEPSLQEGYSEIVRVNFVPKFDTNGEEKLYRLYLLEK